MKTNKKHLFGLAIILAAITFAFIGCSDEGGSKGKTAQEIAADFKADYADALELDIDEVNTNDEAKVNAALEAYEALHADAKALLTEEKELLDNLKEKIDELKAAATAQQLADTFKAGNANALELTVGTVTPLDEIIVDVALESYELLSNDAKALLTEEKDLLDSLKDKIDELQTRITITNATEWNTALATITNVGDGTSNNQKYYTLTIDGNFNLDGSTSNRFSPSYITVILNGRGTIGLSSTGNLFCIGNNQTLVIDSENLILQGRSSNYNTVVYVNSSSATFELRNGTISDNTSLTGSGGGVSISNGSFTMIGGNIRGNTSGYGGGVFVESNGNFTMNGGIISGNTCSGYYGGGVFIQNNGNFTKSNGGIIYGNNAGENSNTVAESARGHAVYYEASSGYYRDTTLGETDDLSTNNLGSGWISK